MKTLVCEEPGRFEYQEAQKPALAPGNVILKIKRIGVCGTDLHAFEGNQPFFSYPRRLGHELGAVVHEVNDGDDLKPGEPVTFIPYFNCGTCVACRMGKTNCCASMKVAGVHVDGGMAEYYAVPRDKIIRSEGLSVDALALVEPLSIGAHGVRRAQILQGEFVLVMGAGPIGLGVMEFARIAGGRVIAMDINEERLKFSKNMGVEFTVNAQNNPENTLKDITNGEWPTTIMDATGSQQAIQRGFDFMAHGGKYILVGLQKGALRVNHPEFHKREGALMSSRNATRQDFENVVGSLKENKINIENFITHRTPFDQVKKDFPSWSNPETGVIKAMIEINDG